MNVPRTLTEYEFNELRIAGVQFIAGGWVRGELWPRAQDTPRRFLGHRIFQGVVYAMVASTVSVEDAANRIFYENYVVNK